MKKKYAIRRHRRASASQIISTHALSSAMMLAMKGRFLLSCTAFCFLVISPCRATILTFDDIPINTGNGSFLTNSYSGLSWSNFAIANAILFTQVNGSNGFYNGMVSVSNVVGNAFGAPAEIDSLTNFNFISTYLTGAWNSNLNIEVRGFGGGAMLYSTTVVVGVTSPTLFTFNYTNIDRLYFNSYGGDYAGFPAGSGEHFVMDNFSFEFVPEPSSLLLTTLGTLTLWPILKRKCRT